MSYDPTCPICDAENALWVIPPHHKWCEWCGALLTMENGTVVQHRLPHLLKERDEDEPAAV